VRALIVGAGAIGSLVGHRLALAGHEVTLVGRQPYVAAVQARGLGVEEGGQVTRTTNVRAVTSVLDGADEPFDLVLLTVKAYDTAEAAAQVEPLARRGVPILIMQNGVGGEETVAELLDEVTILSAVITLSVEVQEPGLVRLATTRGGIGLAPTAPGQSVTELAEVFRVTGFRTAVYRSYQAMKWSKLLLNIVANAAPAILDVSPAESFADSRLFYLEQAAFCEAVAVMRALVPCPLSLIPCPVSLPGYSVPLFAWAICSLPAWLLRPIFQRVIVPGRGGKMPSLHMDLSRGKGKSEVECLNGAVVRYAQELGMDAPVNRALHAVLMGIVKEEIPWEEYRGQPERLLAACGLGKGGWWSGGTWGRLIGGVICF